MATSNSSNFTLTRDNIITQAFLALGIVNPADNLDAEDISTANTQLNMMIKGWEAQGIYIWANNIGSLFLVPGQIEYTLGPNSTDHCASNGYYNTQTTQVHNGGATTINILATSAVTNPTSHITMGDYVGIQLDNNTLFWTTVASVPNSTSITINNALPSTSSAGTQVFTYTTAIGKPLQTTSFRLRQPMPGQQPDRKINLYAREDYFYIPNKFQSGQIIAAYYKPELKTGELFLWMAPQFCYEVVEFNYYRTIQDFDNSTDEPDFPNEWIETLVYNLAVRLGTTFGKDQKLMATIKPIADQMYQDLLDWSKEMSYIQTEPYFDYYT